MCKPVALVADNRLYILESIQYTDQGSAHIQGVAEEFLVHRWPRLLLLESGSHKFEIAGGKIPDNAWIG
jgi:hypothetical protein